MAPEMASRVTCLLGLSFLICASVGLMLTTPAHAATYLIRPDGTGDFPTIQAGLDAIADGDTLLLADGVFSGPGNRDLSMGRPVLFRSQNADPTRCAIDLAGYPLGSAYGSCGFVSIEIRNGRTVSGYMALLQFTGCRFSDPIAVASCQEGGIELVDCEVIGGDSGTGILGSAENVGLERCRVSGHQGASLFGGFHVDARDCIFEQNVCTGSLLRASPWMSMSPSLEAYGCEFYDNSGPEGMLSSTDGHMSAAECTFARNAGPSIQDVVWLMPYDVTVRVTACTMSDNQGAYEIGLVREFGPDTYTAFQLERSILAFRDGGRAVACTGEGIVTEITCSDIFGNEGGDWIGCIAEHYGLDGNIALDPLFCGDGDYGLQGESPCAPGATCAERIGAWPVGCSSDVPAAPEAMVTPLLLPHPNPFTARVSFQGRADAGALTIDLFDAAGRRVRALNGSGGAEGIWVWDGRDTHGSPVPTGVYLYHARSATCEQRGSLILTR